MAEIIIEIPDTKVDLIKSWVESRVAPDIYATWTNQDYVNYVDDFITDSFKKVIKSFQETQHFSTFVFDDPTTE